MAELYYDVASWQVEQHSLMTCATCSVEGAIGHVLYLVDVDNTEPCGTRLLRMKPPQRLW